MLEHIRESLARSMAYAYRLSNNRENAIVLVLHKHPDIEEEILRNMWEAIDAYVDTQEN